MVVLTGADEVGLDVDMAMLEEVDGLITLEDIIMEELGLEVVIPIIGELLELTPIICEEDDDDKDIMLLPIDEVEEALLLEDDIILLAIDDGIEELMLL